MRLRPEDGLALRGINGMQRGHGRFLLCQGEMSVDLFVATASRFHFSALLELDRYTSGETISCLHSTQYLSNQFKRHFTASSGAGEVQANLGRFFYLHGRPALGTYHLAQANHVGSNRGSNRLGLGGLPLSSGEDP